MSRTETPSWGATEIPSAGTIDMKLAVVVISVCDVDRAKHFYGNLGWRLDADSSSDGGGRVVQFTPPGSACSVHFGTKLTSAAPRSAQDFFLVVSDVEFARDELVGRGVEVSEVFHNRGFKRVDPDARVSGPDPERGGYRSFVSFSDPDGNRWSVQEITTRLPGRVAGETASGWAGDLSQALRRAAAAHGEHEKRSAGEYGVNWPDWYAENMVSERAGTELPQ